MLLGLTAIVAFAISIIATVQSNSASNQASVATIAQGRALDAQGTSVAKIATVTNEVATAGAFLTAVPPQLTSAAWRINYESQKADTFLFNMVNLLRKSASSNSVINLKDIELKNQYPITWQALEGMYTDFAVGADIDITKVESGSTCGLVFRLDDNKDTGYKFYGLQLDKNGQIIGYKYIKNVWTALFSGNVNLTISPNQNEVVIVGIQTNFAIYLNGRLISQFTDASLAEGKIGISGESYEASKGTCIFTTVWAWNIAKANS